MKCNKKKKYSGEAHRWREAEGEGKKKKKKMHVKMRLCDEGATWPQVNKGSSGEKRG